jgi:hypothetical protein
LIHERAIDKILRCQRIDQELLGEVDAKLAFQTMQKLGAAETVEPQVALEVAVRAIVNRHRLARL